MDRLIAACALVLAFATSASGAEKRVGLVVGISSYEHAPRLANTENDAKDIAEALRSVGFDVELVLNPDRLNLESAVRRLGQRSHDADASLFYYAGHAIEVAGRNWVVPATAELTNAGDTRFEALDLDSILEQMARGAHTSLVFMDACRDNPFRARLMATSRDLGFRGLTRIDAVSGALIAFATAPGTTAEDGSGRNSPFTAAFLHHLNTPGMELRQFLSEVRREVRESTNGKQIPWENSALEGQFYFVPAPAVIPAPPPPPSVVDSPNPDALFWESVRNSKSPDDYSSYLKQFPKGIFADLAIKKLTELRAMIASAPRTTARVQPIPPAESPVSSFENKLKDLIASAAPTLPVETAIREAGVYAAEKSQGAHQALAVSRVPAGTWRTFRESADNAKEAVLEGCQIFYGNPCTLTAVDGELVTGSGGSIPATQDMPRVRYAGTFDPNQIPASNAQVRRRKDVVEYLDANGPKAVAYSLLGGKLYVTTRAASQRAAEEMAIDACHLDRLDGGVDRPCYLYAVGTQVILPRRFTKPRDAASSIAEAVAVVTAPGLASAYRADPPHKALAVLPENGRAFRWSSTPTVQNAEQHALEGCQLTFGRPCVLIASDEELRSPDPYTAPRQDMARVKYEGSYRLDMVPFQVEASKIKLLNSYPKLHQPKAMALGLGPLRFRVATGVNIADAERKALALCNDPDPVRPCFLYSVNDRVVLPERRTQPSR